MSSLAALPPATPVTAVAYDSRRVVAGAVFVALRGLKADGAGFVPQARARGASLIVGEIPLGRRTSRRRGSSSATPASRWHCWPMRSMRTQPAHAVVGVTGTNGKTTTAYLLAAMLDAADLKAGLLGTVTYRLGGEEREASRTTPEAPDVQQLLDEMIRQGCAPR